MSESPWASLFLFLAGAAWGINAIGLILARGQAFVHIVALIVLPLWVVRKQREHV